MFKSVITGFVVSLLLIGCDVIERPFTENPVDPGPDTGEYVKQNILLEDYTGHTCGNCPEAAEIAEQIAESYGKDRVIVVAVHAGGFADPQPPTYAADYRTSEGTTFDNTFRISRAGNPNGLVNRLPRNGRIIIGKDQWSTVIRELIDDTAAVKLEVQPSYDSSTRTITAQVDITYMQYGTAEYQLVGALVENNIVGDQMDYRKNPSHVEDYVFQHVLRAHMNGTWGEPVSSMAHAKGWKTTKTLSYTIPADKTWDPANMDLVAYVHRHNTTGTGTREVLQVVKAAVTK
ncbi:MAG: Omp28 family outer membrane lipoprotein [Candidatus Kapabacteria bacterium]|nr:Omp28 family outer membrane lipoprotein [Candidatus Kapabacteria bacterium]